MPYCSIKVLRSVEIKTVKCMQELVSVMILASLSWNGTRVEHLFLSCRFELFSSYHSDASHPTHYKEKNPVIL